MIMDRIRHHSSDDMAGLSEFSGTAEPAAVVIRPDGSADVYGYIAVIDQRRGQDECYDADGQPLPYGRCDTCGAPCSADGCTAAAAHEAALDEEDEEYDHSRAKEDARNAWQREDEDEDEEEEYDHSRAKEDARNAWQREDADEPDPAGYDTGPENDYIEGIDEFGYPR
jgi:hypothetical protein